MDNCIDITAENAHLYQDKCIELYQRCFKEPPYNEDWPYNTVLEIWKLHRDSGHIVTYQIDDKLVGFIYGYRAGLKINDDIDQMMKEVTTADISLDFDLNDTMYISELAVMKEHRRKGIARALADHLFKISKTNAMTHYLLRSDLNNSQSAPLFIKYYNGKQLDIVTGNDLSEISVNSASEEKGHWYGPL